MMKHIKPFFATVFYLSISIAISQPQGGPPPGGRIMGGLLVPKVINPSDNSTSTILENLPSTMNRLSELPEGSGLKLTKDVVYRKSTDLDGKPLDMKMDVISHMSSTKLPLVIFITGGGFMFAPKEGNLYAREELAKQGFVVASISYHVINNGIYSDAVKDVKASVRYLRAHANEFGVDGSRIALWGESAGGYLTAMAGTSNGAKEFEEGDNLNESSSVNACIDSFGLSDLTKIGADYDDEAKNAHFTVDSPDGKYIHGKNSGLTSLDKPEVVVKSNPLNYVDKSDPPFLFFHGMKDGLVSPSQTLLVHEALRKVNVPSTRYVIAEAGHGGGQFSSPEVLKIMVDFLRSALK